MDAQELRNLSEAYLDVYQLDEGLTPAQIEKIAKKAAGKPTTKSAKKIPAGMKEQADLYDIILSHLLDEGYAETQEAAEVIMVNMSEEWRDDIVEMQYTAPPQPAAEVRPAPSSIRSQPPTAQQKIQKQRRKGAGMAAQAALGLGSVGAVALSNRRKKYRM